MLFAEGSPLHDWGLIILWAMTSVQSVLVYVVYSPRITCLGCRAGAAETIAAVAKRPTSTVEIEYCIVGSVKTLYVV